MTDPPPWWARPGGASPTPGQPPPIPGPPPTGQQPYWNPNLPNNPPAQGNPYVAPQQPYGSPSTSRPPWQGGYQGYGGTNPQPKSSSRWLLMGGLAIVAVLVVVGGLVAWQSLGGGKVLDVRQAEAGVQEILSDPINGYGANDVTSVTCNGGDNPKVETNDSFTCQVEINGTTRTVNVEFTDDEGTYAVDGPR